MCLHFSKRNFMILPINDCQEFSQCFHLEVNHIFLINAPVGTSTLDTDALARWDRYYDDISSQLENSFCSKMIFTCGLQVFKKEKNGKFVDILHRNAIDIYNGEYELTYRDRQSLLRKHKLFLYNTILYEEFNHPSFPSLCKAVMDGKEIQDIPFSFYAKQIKQLLAKEEYSYLLYLVFIKKNRFIKGEENINELVENYIRNPLRVQVPPLYDLQVDNRFCELEGSFLKETDGVYSFINETVYDIVAYNAGLMSKEIVIETCSREFFRNKLTFDPVIQKTSKLSLLLGKHDFENWFRRLEFEIRKGSFVDILFCKQFADSRIKELVMAKVRQLPSEELIDILVQTEEQVKLFYKIPEHLVCILKDFPLNKGLNFLCAVLLAGHFDLFIVIWKHLKVRKQCSRFDKNDLMRVAVIAGNIDCLKNIVKTVWTKNSLSMLMTLTPEKIHKSLVNSFPVCISSACGHLDFVRYFHDIGFDMNERNKHMNDDGSLSYAARFGYLEIVRYLISRNADVNVQNNEGRTPLMWAIEHSKIASVLLYHEADIHLCDNNGENALMTACGLGKIDIVDSILNICETSQIPIMINKQKTNGCTALHKACEYEIKKTRNEIAAKLLQKKANPRTFDTVQHSSPLHIASAQNDSDLAKSLLLFGAEVNCKDKFQVTPLFIAAENGFSEMVQVLLECGADPHIQRNTDCTSPLLIAAERGKLEVVKTLLKWIKDEEKVNAVNHQKCTPLLMAMSNNHTKVCEVLLENKADVNVSNNNGYYPIHVAARNSNAKLANILIGKGIDIDSMTDEDENTPLHIAAMVGDNSVARILLAAGADMELKNGDNLTPLELATNMKQMDIRDILLEFRMFGLSCFIFQTDNIETLRTNSSSSSLESVASLHHDNAKPRRNSYGSSKAPTVDVDQITKVPSRRSIAGSSASSVIYGDKGSIKSTRSLHDPTSDDKLKKAILPVFRIDRDLR